MTYYEELGIAIAASNEEIRHAYRRVARLIHPDQCTDDETRRLADLQMKRLNSVMAVLADGTLRAKYDASILDVPRLPEAPRVPFGRMRLQAAAGAVVLLIALLVAVWPRRHPAPKPLPSPPPLAKAASSPKKPVYRQIRQERRPVLAPSPLPVFPEPPAAAAELPTVTAIHALAPIIPPVVSKAPPTLSGHWLFVPSPSIKHSGYPPEYIELRLTENSGVLHGLYQARYRVTDRAISPNVAFRFDGSAESDGGLLPWEGPGGAKGEVTLRLLPTGNLEVDWVARQLGQELGLISGTATLVRKIE